MNQQASKQANKQTNKKKTKKNKQTKTNKKHTNKKKKGNVDVRVARIFNTFGPRMNPADGRVVSNFIVQVRSGVSDLIVEVVEVLQDPSSLELVMGPIPVLLNL
jgi:hypothetical protein